MNALNDQIGQANYSAAKVGVIGHTNALALENAANSIKANCIAPGFIETDIAMAIPEPEHHRQIAEVPANRPGRTADVAELAAYITFDRAAFITGQVVSMNGGQLMP